jgi:transcriptional regulator with XRE-family HTH domain
MFSMSQEKLGHALGLTFQQVQKYEKGTNRIGAGRLCDIARILQVSGSFFFEGAPALRGAPVEKGRGAVAELRERFSRHFGWACARQGVHPDQGICDPALHRQAGPGQGRLIATG